VRGVLRDLEDVLEAFGRRTGLDVNPVLEATLSITDPMEWTTESRMPSSWELLLELWLFAFICISWDCVGGVYFLR
jgi:hypothetical protein